VTEADATFAYQRARAPSDAGPPDRGRERPPSDGPARNDPRPTARWPTRAELALEYRTVLAELDAIHRILGIPSEPGVLGPRELARADPGLPAPTEPLRASPDPRGAASPYLDDRLASACEVAAGITTEFEAIQRRTQGLRDSVATLRAELDRAAEELAFLRSGPGIGPGSDVSPAPLPPGLPPTARNADAPVAAPGHSQDGRAPPAYGAFTVARYNETVREVRSRRPRLFGTTLLLAAAISALLVTLAYFAHEAMPVWWLAGLPLVWMIPVPFFVVSFVGTHRILSAGPLELPEAA
jgi:hypothetical protein